MLENFWNDIKTNSCPLPHYYYCHTIIALLIAALFWWPLGLNAALCMGVMFYIGRKVKELENGLPMDWPGLLWPAGACFITGLAAHFLGLK